MYSLPRPKITVSEVLNAISARTSARSEIIASVTAALVADELDHSKIVATGDFHLFRAKPLPAGILSSHLIDLYDDRFAKVGSSGRKFYNKIRAATSAASYGRCPYCALSSADTVDHHLPKSVFPLLSITPANLVPSCGRCNRLFREQAPASRAECKPYPYDPLPKGRWLQAKLVNPDGELPAFSFEIVPPASWEADVASQMRNMFSTLQLAELYGPESGRVGVKAMREVADMSAEERKANFVNQFEYWASVDENSIEAACFAALAEAEA